MFRLGSNFFGTLWASWTSWKSISFARLGKVLHYLFEWVVTFCSSSSPSGTPIIRMLERFKMSWRILSLSSFFWILVSSFFSGWMFYFFLLVHTIDLSSSFLPITIVPCTFSFVSLSIPFIFSSNLWPNSTNSVSILITSISNCASDRLTISSVLRYIISAALICSFIWASFFFFVLACLLCNGAEP